ncbi:hypothetical protein SEVIR_3G271050v4 [Setaria viridis]
MTCIAIAFHKGDIDLHPHAFRSCSFAVLVRAVDGQEARRPVPAGVPYTLLQDQWMEPPLPILVDGSRAGWLHSFGGNDHF